MSCRRNARFCRFLPNPRDAKKNLAIIASQRKREHICRLRFGSVRAVQRAHSRETDPYDAYAIALPYCMLF